MAKKNKIDEKKANNAVPRKSWPTANFSLTADVFGIKE
jgi:hypothetical protein